MEKFTREQIKSDPALMKVLNVLGTKHKLLKQTQEKLLEAKNPNLAASDRFFGEFQKFDAEGSLYISYETTTWYNVEKGKFDIRVENMTFYENYVEFEGARYKSNNENPQGTEGVIFSQN